MKRLIVNADDFGWSPDATEGIIEAHARGIVTSTTVMANLPGAAEALAKARAEAPGLGIGVHLTLTEGRPLSKEGAALADADGNFRRGLAPLFLRAAASSAARKAIAAEFEAQLARAADMELKAAHIDSHKHVHMHPAILPEAIAAAKRFGITAMRTAAELDLPAARALLPKEWTGVEKGAQWLRARIIGCWGRRAKEAARRAGLRTTDWFYGARATGGISAPLLVEFLRTAPDGTGELMVHPGRTESVQTRSTRIDGARPLELAALMDESVKAAAKEFGWEFVNFSAL